MNMSITKKMQGALRSNPKFSAENRLILIGFVFFTILFGIGVGYIAANYSPVFAMIAVFAIPAAILFFLHPEIGLIISVFLIPFENITSFTLLGFSGFELITMIVYSAAVAHYLVFRKKDSLISTKMNWFLLLFILFMLLSNLTALDQDRSISGSLRLLRNVSLYIFAINLIRSKKSFYPLLWALVISGVISALYGLYGYFYDQSLLESNDMVLRVRGTMDDPNEFAGAMVVRVMIAIGLFEAVSKKSQRVFLSIAILLLVYSIILSGSRGGLLGILAAFLVFILARKNKGRWLIIGTLLAVVGIALMPLSLKQRVGLVETGENVGNNLTRRVTYFLLGEEIIKEKPVLGIGLDGFATAYAESEYRFLANTDGRIAHNTYLEIAIGMGIPGLTLFLILIGYSCFKVLQISRSKRTSDLTKVSAGLFAGLAGYLVVLFFLSQQYEKTFWLLLGMAVIIEQLYHKESSLQDLELASASG